MCVRFLQVDEEAEKAKKEKKETKKVKEIQHDWEHLNQQKPIWMRKPDEIKEEEYASFYKVSESDNVSFLELSAPRSFDHLM